MYKILTVLRYGMSSCVHPKLWRIMKLSFFICLLAFLHVSAASVAQKISLDKKNATLRETLNDIRKQSGYSIICDVELLNEAQRINLHIKNVSLDEALKQCFLDQPLSYVINKNTIVVTPNPPTNSIVKKWLSISGSIIDESKMPLPGVTVKVENSPTAVSTNENGFYTINVPDEKAVLVFSSIGYLTERRVVGKTRMINLQMTQENSKLNEVVVVGYGTVLKKDLTGSVGSVKMDEMQKAPVRSFEEALAGRVAGVAVASGDGQPGSSSTITIRGNNSITQNNSPLYVIDGFPLENADNNAINPAEIESVEILKDASATAIYGARGANGVIMVTTKRGKTGEPVVTYNGYFGLQKNRNEVALMNAYEFVKLQQDLNAVNADKRYFTNGRTLDSYRTEQGVNWQDRLFRTAPMQNHYMAVNGGNANTKYSLSGSITNQDGIILNTGFNRYQGRLILDQKINEKFKIGANINYSNTSSSGSVVSNNYGSLSTLSLMYSVWAYRPVNGTGSTDDLIDELYDPAIDVNNDLRSNPVITAENTYNRRIVNSLIINAYAEYNFTKSLKLRVTGGANRSDQVVNIFNNSQTPLGNPLSPQGKGGPNGSVTNNRINDLLNENTLTYNGVIGKNHKINVLGGFTVQQTNFNNFGAIALQVPNETLGISGLDEGTSSTITSVTSLNRLVSFLSRVNYSYKDKYLVTASFRSDGSSKFAPGNKWSYFPSGSVAWRLTREDFMKNLPVITDAKLRASYGITGNNRVSDFAYLATLVLPNSAVYPFNNRINKGAIKTALGNQNLKWENTSQLDLGMDVSLLKDRVSFTADYYRKTTYDLLLNANLPPTAGLPNAFKNIGKVRNDGFEFTINTTNISNTNFSWTTNFNIAFNRNKILALTENQENILTNLAWDANYVNTPLYTGKIGEPIAQFYGYKWDGVYQYSDFDKSTAGVYTLKADVPTNGNTRGSIQPGDIKYVDINGDGVVNADDRTVIGKPYPLYTGGLSNTFKYKGFDLNVFFQWSAGNDLFNANRLVFEGSTRLDQNQYASFTNRWTPDNQNNDMFRVGGQGPYAYSSRVIEDGSFLRLKTVALGYNLPAPFVKKIKLKTLRVYTAAQNLITWTNYSGPDPEVSARNSALTPGFDYSAYPRASTITFGLNTTF